MVTSNGLLGLLFLNYKFVYLLVLVRTFRFDEDAKRLVCMRRYALWVYIQYCFFITAYHKILYVYVRTCNCS